MLSIVKNWIVCLKGLIEAFATSHLRPNRSGCEAGTVIKHKNLKKTVQRTESTVPSTVQEPDKNHEPYLTYGPPPLEVS
jgi:hypothetical protein